VRVNCIAPGYIYSPMVAMYTSDQLLELRRKAGPLEFNGTPWDVA
jgi:NAD(P)-dependent dehydrogenase (short-subunit alcohol dehydrogenase family)